jgi:hypothetical protein
MCATVVLWSRAEPVNDAAKRLRYPSVLSGQLVGEPFATLPVLDRGKESCE